MIKISQEEFEIKIKEIIQGKKSKADVIKELQTDSRTLNNKIQELVVYNIDLYNEFINKKPFKSKTRDDIDYEALVIKMVKHSMFTVEAAAQFDIGVRTIQRIVKRVEKDNPELIAIYRAVKKANKNNLKIPYETQKQIDELVERPVKITEINEKRKKELENIEKIFNERLEQYGTKEKAARSMGFTSNRIYKLLNELYRIKIEDNTKKFREDIKVEQNINTAPINSEKEYREPSMEGVEK